MLFELIRLEFIKSFRSTAFAKSVMVAIFLGFLAIMFLSYLLMAGLFLNRILEVLAEGENTIEVLNSGLIFFFLVDFMYRYFLQKLPVIELESLLHLPISKHKIMHMLLGRSFFSPLSIIALILFTPFAFTVIGQEYGIQGAISWLGTVVFISWTLHWFMLWFKQRFEDGLIGVGIVFAILLLGGGSTYMGWFNLGEIVAPFFRFAMSSSIPLLATLVLCGAGYYMAFSYYLNNAYLEDLSDEEEVRFVNQSVGFFSRFGMAGELANLEWKLIIRHKKSRTFLMLSAFFLLYGTIFYDNPAYQDGPMQHMFIFVGIFITGIFTIQYGQLFLSWNSSYFDFFLTRKDGIKNLVKGKYLLLLSISVLCFLLSIPYVYYGWKFLLIHFATFLFNAGIMIHVITYLAIWKPKPMDLNKGAMFNYEGVGAAQFLMIIPMMVAPYLIYLPFALFFNMYAGLAALGTAGVIGILFFNKLATININRVLKNRFEISSSFRQEL
ncbi:hypothetical protein LV84_04015 [Algoriphagus ratkowskyi]|uniref:ABC-2 type transport system permease protein n=1 Tax=Algoriphagus ratkowskyi TaxID=57028 RepID=A0A2W7QPL3_9BACT|nr:DUF5687 family protein [Algoriphagus ratkowskyi]PZX50453.1 hypothetical protein LV84_04015 [Algoriphagus ratkowskyi]TXD75735.1 hypothetical protein ESW18_19470 [Algoriphagus ratkowskyi]